METNLNKIKEKSKMLYYLVDFDSANICPKLKGFIISHPYTNSGFFYYSAEKRMLNLLDSDDDKELFENLVMSKIDCAEKIMDIYIMLNNPYKLFWLKLIYPFLSEKDFGEWFREIWVTVENPNDDINVSLKDIKNWLKKCPQKYLMTNEDYKYYQNLPDKVTVYRGVSPKRNPNGFSYTIDKSKAEWFKNRFEYNGSQGFLIELEVDKSDILAYFDTRNEKEILLDSYKYRKKIAEQIPNS